MKALSVHPCYAMDIMFGVKSVECRSWRTDYRGDILICSTAHKMKGTIPGHALCVVTLKDIVPFTRKHLKAACMFDDEYQSNQYAWILENPHFITPFAVKGKLSLWNCDNDVAVFDPEGKLTPEDWDKHFKSFYKPLYV